MIPFEIPARFLADVAAGAAYRIGTTLRDRVSGRIVAHLQETAALATTVATGPPGGFLLAAANLAQGHLVSQQVGQVLTSLAALQLVGTATLAMSAVGVGVGVAGFAVVQARLAAIEQKLVGVGKRIDDIQIDIDWIKYRLETVHQADLHCLLNQADEAWAWTDPVAAWKGLPAGLNQAHHFHRLLAARPGGRSILLDPRFSIEEAVAAYEAAILLGTARVQILLLLGEVAAALRFAEDVRSWAESAIGPLRTVDVIQARWKGVADRDGIREDDARLKLHRVLAGVLEALHEARDCLVSRPALLEEIARRGLPGRGYVEALRAERRHPVLVLPA